METRPRLLPALAALLGFACVAAGAFAAHAVKDETTKALLRTGAEYGMIHALAVYAALGVEARGGKGARLAGWLFVVGGWLFAGSLFVLAASGVRAAGLVTPIGGLSMLAGWLALAYAALSAS